MIPPDPDTGPPFISGVILAAGRSARLGRPKQLLPLGGLPLLAHVIRHAAASTLDDIVLVLGHEAPAIQHAVGDWGQRVVLNADYAAGQSTSVRAALATLPPAATAALFLLGDQPQVGPTAIDALLAAHRASPGAAPILQPTYGGTPGNPVLFARPLFPALARLTGDQGARGLLRAHPELVARVPVPGAAPPGDVDTDEDYRTLLAAWAASGPDPPDTPRAEFDRAATPGIRDPR